MLRACIDLKVYPRAQRRKWILLEGWKEAGYLPPSKKVLNWIVAQSLGVNSYCRATSHRAESMRMINSNQSSQKNLKEKKFWLSRLFFKHIVFKIPNTWVQLLLLGLRKCNRFKLHKISVNFLEFKTLSTLAIWDSK